MYSVTFVCLQHSLLPQNNAMKDKKREEAQAAADKQRDTTQTTKQSPRKKKGRGRKRKADESFQLSDFMDNKVRSFLVNIQSVEHCIYLYLCLLVCLFVY